jgi:hypothetical protein
MYNGGAEAMLNELLHYDYRDVNLRKPPETEALQDQKFRTLPYEQKWWLYGILIDGEFSLAHNWEETKPLTVSKDVVYESYLEYMKNLRNVFIQDKSILGRDTILKIAKNTELCLPILRRLQTVVQGAVWR